MKGRKGNRMIESANISTTTSRSVCASTIASGSVSVSTSACL